MTKRETYCTIRGLKVWATAGLMLILVLSSGLALAAQIDITNCTDTKVKICSYDYKKDITNTTPEQSGVHALDAFAVGHFTCKANCNFQINSHDTNHGCQEGDNWHWLDHDWGSGIYSLISLDKNSKGKYKSSDLWLSGGVCP